MNTIFKTLLTSSFIILTASNANADQTMGFDQQGAVWDSGQVPIVWGDCIPVPVESSMMPPMNMPMGNMGNSMNPMFMQPMPVPSGFPMQGSMPAQNFDPSFNMPPPSPFFNNQIPAPMPLPVAPQIVEAPTPVCNDHSAELHSLQGRYNQAAAASRTKIEDMTLAMQDAQNQISDARVIIEKLSKEQEADRSKISTLGELNQGFVAKQKDAEANLNKASTYANELARLKQEYDAMNNERNALQQQLMQAGGAYKSLQAQLGTLKSESGAQARKLTALGQSSTELSGLKSAYKSQNNENATLKKNLANLEKKLSSLNTMSTLKGAQDLNIINALKKKLTGFDNANKTLKSQLTTAEASSGAQARKLTALGQSATQLGSLQSAYKARNNENVLLKKQLADADKKFSSLNTMVTLKGAQDTNIISALKKKLADFDSANKTLKTQLASAEASSGAQARKLTALGQSSSKLVALKSAYDERNTENGILKGQLAQSERSAASCKAAFTDLQKKLAGLDNANKTLKTQLASAETNSGAQARKLTALGQSASELVALKSAYDERNTENGILKGQLSHVETSAKACKTASTDLHKKLLDSENDRKTLLAKIGMLETNSANQARKITVLTSASGELGALKSAYKDLNAKKASIASKLTAATADTDKDGVLNSADKCPYSLEGVEVNSIGCLADEDNDGIADSKDKCSASPVGSHVNEVGCPREKDTDSDGVADASDLCANTATGTKVNEFGCAPTESITLKGVNFKLGSAKLTSASFPILDAAAETLKKSSNLKIEIAGHTDYQGAAALNKNLSQRRANTVMIYLIKQGVSVEGLTAKGYGEEKPVASNKTKEGRATNRRVELMIK